MSKKTSLLDWCLDEDTDNPDMLPIGQFMTIKKKNEIYSVPCPVCGKPSDGYACSENPKCPFDAPLFI